ncbi:MAG: lipoate--protein ligase family protein [Anaerolineae bacterium]|nr:lipoate--protein ligase family protein [Anaerolineae bacterium]
MNFELSTWRLLNTGFSDGASNMAVDEAILTAVAEGKSPPTLRFYGWQPPCVSIGYAQSMRAEIDLQACRRKGYTWVRRPTGGRAVLHIDELTYSVIAPADEPRVSGDILTSYRRLSRGLVEGLSALGCAVCQAEMQDGGKGESAACFDVPSHYEVTALGHKLVGSAQVRRKGVVLQHGALPLTGDVSRLADVLNLDEPERKTLRAKLLQRAVTLKEAAGYSISFERAVDALRAGFGRALNLHLEPGSLSDDERSYVALLREKYLDDAWMFSK